jgi:diguanylate cyclase (GGDEF)-like protein
LIDGEQIILYLPLAIVFGILLCAAVLRSKGNIRSDRSVFFLACIFLWTSLELLFFFMGGEFVSRYVFELKFIPLAFLPIAFLHYSISFYRVKHNLPRWVLPALLGIPAVTSVFALIPVTMPFIISGYRSNVDYDFGFWYYIYLTYQNLVYAAVGVIVVMMFRRLPGAYRRGSVFHIIYLGTLLVTQIAYFSGHGILAFDLQYFGYSICGLLFYFAHLLNSDSATANIDQNSVFDFLDQAIFILNEEGIIVAANGPAVLWLKSLGRRVENVDFDGLLTVLANNKKITVKKLEDSTDSDVHFTGVAIPLIYRMERRAFLMSDGITKGEFITLTDVSRNRLLIDRLRDMAGVDGLTGTANRYRYQDLLRKLDKNENYPLAVVIGDVNGLKFVNDTYGHLMGDQYIKDIAAVMMDCCPKGSYVARYGGDEFATLLVRTSPEEVESYIDNVNKTLRKPIEGSVVQPSISMGYAIKHHGNENLSALIGQADQKMYADKMARKKAEREALENA